MMNTNAIFAIVVLVAVVGAVQAFVVSEPVYGAVECKSQGPVHSEHSNGGDKDPLVLHGCGSGLDPDPDPDPDDEEEDEEDE